MGSSAGPFRPGTAQTVTAAVAVRASPPAAARASGGLATGDVARAAVSPGHHVGAPSDAAVGRRVAGAEQERHAGTAGAGQGRRAGAARELRCWAGAPAAAAPLKQAGAQRGRCTVSVPGRRCGRRDGRHASSSCRMPHAAAPALGPLCEQEAHRRRRAWASLPPAGAAAPGQVKQLLGRAARAATPGKCAASRRGRRSGLPCG
ncbi:hypothetical protein BS78_08G056300 [Paspalum vaginatum]|nr:hypothetical protein BS78_08G056300 [Paspalum vaginatum]